MVVTLALETTLQFLIYPKRRKHKPVFFFFFTALSNDRHRRNSVACHLRKLDSLQLPIRWYTEFEGTRSRDQTTTPNFYLARLDGALDGSEFLAVTANRKPARDGIIHVGGKSAEQRKRRDQSRQMKHLSLRRGEQSATINAHAPTNWNRGHASESLRASPSSGDDFSINFVLIHQTAHILNSLMNAHFVFANL